MSHFWSLEQQQLFDLFYSKTCVKQPLKKIDKTKTPRWTACLDLGGCWLSEVNIEIMAG